MLILGKYRIPFRLKDNPYSGGSRTGALCNPENLAVKLYIIFLAALEVLCPKDGCHSSGRTFWFSAVQASSSSLSSSFFSGWMVSEPHPYQLLVLVDSLGFRCVFLDRKISTGMKEQYFWMTNWSLVLIAELQAVLIEEQVIWVPTWFQVPSSISNSVPPSHSQCTEPRLP